MEIAASMEELIGNTPMVRLVRVTAGVDTTIVAKLETTNPGGSVKDRPALWMINAAEKEGLLRPGGTIIEPTSGNTGVGLAIIAAQRGYKCIFVMTDKVSEEKVTLLRAYGAEVVVCPVAVAPDDPQSYYSTAERLVADTPDAFRPNQYFNPVNPLSHYETTGPEIWRQTDGKITHFVAGAGTGGTLSGIGRYLKEQNPDVKVIAADPEGSVYSGGSGRPYLVEGVGEDFWPPTYHADLVDDVIPISDADSFEMARRVTMEEGLLVGGSCGTAVAAALEVGRTTSPDDLIVVLIPDSGRGYLSKIFNDEWMSSFGFLTADGVIVNDVIEAKDSGVPTLVYIQPQTPVKDAIDLMQEHSVSQLPVAKGEMPLAAAEIQGSVSELFLMERVFGGDDVLSKTVEEVMAPALPTVGVGEPIELAVQRLDSSPALLVLNGGRPRTVISRTDVLSYLQAQDASGTRR
jgi:cystathionine beta-synthase